MTWKPTISPRQHDKESIIPHEVMRSYFFGVCISLSLAGAAGATTLSDWDLRHAADTLAMLAVSEVACNLSVESYVNAAIGNLAEQNAGVLPIYRGLLMLAEYNLEQEISAGRLDTYCAAARGAARGLGWD